MKYFIPLILIFSLMSCSNMSKRGIASEGNGDITRIGVAMYPSTEMVEDEDNHWDDHPGYVEVPSQRKYKAVRLYLKDIPSEPGNYYAVLLEYHKLGKVGPSYAISKVPVLAAIFGHLNKITTRIQLYKAVPTEEGNVYNLETVYMDDNNKVQIMPTDSPSQLILSTDSKIKHPLEGAKITPSLDGEPVAIQFPKDDSEEEWGFQYNFANYVYKKAKLGSTWRNNFLTGPYLGSYENKKHGVLKLSGNANGGTAVFNKNKKRAKRLTNPKSALISGEFKAEKISEGVFHFTEPSANATGSGHVKKRFALFIDVFDATKSLGQDVVELVLTNPNDPTDFLMYYEHPDNGEGTKGTRN